MPASALSSTRLSRKIGTLDAVFLGLGSMIGAGIFTAAGPAADAAGTGILIATSLAGAISYLNATTMAQLAAVYPESGGTYIYGRKRLGNIWGFLAGWGFVIGKLASCTAMALTFAYYANPDYPRTTAALAVIILTFVNYLGIKKTALTTKALVAATLFALCLVAIAAFSGGAADFSRLAGWTSRGGVPGILRAAGIMFFAFAGYARIATLGEEVIEPKSTIPKAILISLGVTVAIYIVIIGATLITVDIEALAGAKAPLVLTVESGSYAFLAPAVRVGACCASLGVLLSLMAGISRTAFAMAANGELPRFLSEVHSVRRVPYKADLAVCGAVVLGVAFGGLRSAIGFSSFAILIYYALANAACMTLEKKQRLWPRGLALAGLVCCLTLALSLPRASVLGGAFLFAVGLLIFWVRSRRGLPDVL